MSRSTRSPSLERVFYRDVKPYEAPSAMDHLRGPRRGELRLPSNVYWGPDHTFDLGDRSDLVEAYQATLREGRSVDQTSILNADLLREVWAELMLPVRVRSLWEERFPELAVAA